MKRLVTIYVKWAVRDTNDMNSQCETIVENEAGFIIAINVLLNTRSSTHNQQMRIFFMEFDTFRKHTWVQNMGNKIANGDVINSFLHHSTQFISIHSSSVCE